jgi:predicted ATPase
MALRFTSFQLRNWRNFVSAEAELRSRVFLVGPNAVGKSNLLDAFRCLRDVAGVGGGLQMAVARRGGVGKIRCLAARRAPDLMIDVTMGNEHEPEQWRYRLVFGGKKNAEIIQEKVWRSGKLILSRPDEEDHQDVARLAQTALEQVNANREFRPVVEFLASARYLHLVPQLVREPDRSVNHPDDPFGGDFLDQVARTPKNVRDARLRRIGRALTVAVPQLSELKLNQDNRGAWHLEGRYQHWRPQGARQDEKVFSDGTLRLIGLLWAVLDGESPLLLEEPELSLHPDVVRQIPQVFARVQRGRHRQIIVSSHSPDLVDDPGIGLDEVLLLQPGANGTTISPMSSLAEAEDLLRGGSRMSEIIRPRTRPGDVAQLPLFTEQ